MAKKLVAVTAVRHNGEDFEPGGELDTTKFTKEELKSLYDAGAVEVQDNGKPESDMSASSDASPSNPQGQDAQQVGDVPAVAKQGAQAGPATSAPTTNATTNATSAAKTDSTKK